jgi:hypothetical protein
VLVAGADEGWYKRTMTLDEFRATLTLPEPPGELPAPLAALWWDAKGDWARAHGMVDDLETPDAMAVHAYLHRKEGVDWNADYWYSRAGREFRRPTLEAEWEALVEGLPGA